MMMPFTIGFFYKSWFWWWLIKNQHRKYKHYQNCPMCFVFINLLTLNYMAMNGDKYRHTSFNAFFRAWKKEYFSTKTLKRFKVHIFAKFIYFFWIFFHLWNTNFFTGGTRAWLGVERWQLCLQDTIPQRKVPLASSSGPLFQCVCAVLWDGW